MNLSKFNKKQSIIFSSNTAWYLYNFRRSSISAVLNIGYNVYCISGEDKFSKRLEQLGAEFIPLPIKRSGTNPFQEIYLIYFLIKNFKKISPLLVFNFTAKNNFYGAIAAKLLGINCINNISGLGTGMISNSKISLLMKFFYKLIRNFPIHTHVQNQDDFLFLESHKLINKKKSSLIPGSGIDTDIFNPNHFPEEKDNQKFNFIFVGRLLKDKGLIELYHAFEMLILDHPNVHLNIVGIIDTDNPSALDIEQIQMYDEHPKITLYKNIEDVKPFLASADCLVLPSYREGLSRSILEGMSMKLPIITTNVPGCSNLVQDNKHGFICEPQSSHSLYLALNKMALLSEATRARFGKAGRSLVKEKYCINLVIKSVLDIIDNLNYGKK